MKKLGKRLVSDIASAGLGYAVGNLNPAYIMGLRRGYDIRKRGSKNAGAILGITAPFIFSKHRENLRRIKQGKELKLDFLWDKDGELDRIGWVGEVD